MTYKNQTGGKPVGWKLWPQFLQRLIVYLSPEMSLTSYSKKALTGGVVSALAVGFGAFLVGNVSGYEAKQLLKVSLDGVNTLCNTVVLASATRRALLRYLFSIERCVDFCCADAVQYCEEYHQYRWAAPRRSSFNLWWGRQVISWYKKVARTIRTEHCLLAVFTC